MNSCGRIVSSEWRSGFNAVLSRFTLTRIHCRRCSRAAAAAAGLRLEDAAATSEPAPGTDKATKPRLRAIDLARKVQQEKEKAKPRVAAAEAPMSVQQKRVSELKRFSLQLQNVHPNVLAKHLHKSVLYQDKDLVVINKPYGVSVRDDSGATSIASVLPVLSKMMDGVKIKSDSQLFPSLGLEKEVTGALLLARREEMVERILDLHRNNRVQRKYWVITVGVPVPSEGVVDIPIIEREITGSQPHYKMGLSPLFKMNDAGDGMTKVRAHRQAHSAATKYRVLDSSAGCSLVELQPFTAVKHQMRVHMALALTCPILGDHKYSNWSKLAPQRLPERVLGKLGLEQSKVRHLPLHLLARQLTVAVAGRDDIVVSCPPPKYFTQTLNRLQLSPPDRTDNE